MIDTMRSVHYDEENHRFAALRNIDSAAAWLLLCLHAVFAQMDGICAGLCLHVAAIPVHKLAKGRPIGYIAAILLNAAGSGLVMGVYYAWRGVRFGAFEAAVAAACALEIALASVLLAAWRFRKWASVGMGVLLLVLLVWSIVCWCTADAGLFSLLFFRCCSLRFGRRGCFSPGVSSGPGDCATYPCACFGCSA